MNDRTIGVLTAELSDSYQSAVWNGILAESLHGRESVICFLGSRINSPDAQEAAANTVYELASPANIGGLIVVASAISTYAGRGRVQRLFDAHGSIPKVSIGVPVTGACSLSVDSLDALNDLVDHLVTTHERTRFALIAGPRWHVESQERRSIVSERLKHHGIDLDPTRVIHGSFEPESGESAARLFLDGPELPDAVICLNDRMAIGALNEFNRCGVKVPNQLSVTGFDGIEDGRYCTPSLTTVHQPLQDLGRSAMQAIRAMMNGRGPDILTLRCRTMIRESCGCAVHPDEFSSIPVEYFHGDSLTTRSVSPEIGRLEAFPSTVLPDSSVMNLGELKARQQASRRLAYRDRTKRLREVGLSLSEAFETPVLLDRLREGLTAVGFSEGYLVLSPGSSEIPTESSLMIAGTTDKGFVITDNRFPASKILPDGYPGEGGCRAWMLVPLVFARHALGYLVLPGDAPDGEVYEILALQLASSLRGAMLMDQVRGHERSLENEVRRRTEQLVDINQALRIEISNRIRLETEVNEISLRTMERIGQDLHDDLCQYLAAIAMHSGVLENRLALSCPGLRPMSAKVNRLLADAIARTRAIARGLLPVGLKEGGLNMAIGALVDATTKGSRIPVSFVALPEADNLDSGKALALYRIVQEAINNSVRHSRCRRIEIRLEHENSESREPRLVAQVFDDGVGIDPDAMERGMGLSIMRHRAKKAGAVLSILPADPGTVVRCSLPAGRGSQ